MIVFAAFLVPTHSKQNQTESDICAELEFEPEAMCFCYCRVNDTNMTTWHERQLPSLTNINDSGGSRLCKGVEIVN